MRTESTSILYSDGNAFLGCASHYHNPLHQRLPQSPKTHWVFTRLSQHPLCYFQRCLPGYTWRENCKPLVLGKRKIIISCTRVEPLNRGLVHGSLPAGTQLQTSLKIREGDTDCFDTEQVISSPQLARCTSSRENNAYQCSMFFSAAHSIHIQNVNWSIFILWFILSILFISTSCSWGPHSCRDAFSFK